MAGGNVINNYYDRKKDKTNPYKCGRNPFASGKIDAAAGPRIYTILFLIGNLLAISSLKIWTICISILATTLLVFYTWVKYEGFLNGFASNIIIGSLVGLLYIYGWSVFEKTNPMIVMNIFFAFFFSFLSTLDREIIKGVADHDVDLKTQIKTIATVYSSKTAISISTIITFLIIILSPMPYFYGVVTEIYVILVLITDVILASVMLELWFENSPSNATLMKNRIRVGMIIALIAFFFGNGILVNDSGLVLRVGNKLLISITNSRILSLINAAQFIIIAIIPTTSFTISYKIRSKYLE